MSRREEKNKKRRGVVASTMGVPSTRVPPAASSGRSGRTGSLCYHTGSTPSCIRPKYRRLDTSALWMRLPQSHAHGLSLFYTLSKLSAFHAPRYRLVLRGSLTARLARWLSLHHLSRDLGNRTNKKKKKTRKEKGKGKGKERGRGGVNCWLFWFSKCCFLREFFFLLNIPLLLFRPLSGWIFRPFASRPRLSFLLFFFV